MINPMNKRLLYLISTLIFVTLSIGVKSDNISTTDSITQKIRRIENPEIAVDSYIESWRYLRNHDKKFALSFMKEGEFIAQSINNYEAQSTINWQIGLIFQDMGDYDSARIYMDNSLAIAKNNALAENEITATHRIGALMYRMGESDSAQNYYQHALQHSTDIDYAKGKMLCYADMGKLEKRHGNYDLALSYFLKSLKISNELGLTDSESHALMNMSIIYAKMKDYVSCRESNHKALSIAVQTSDESRQLQLYNNMAVMLRITHEYDSSIYYQMLGLEKAREINSRPQVIRAYMNLGTTNAYQKKFEEATAYYDTANRLSLTSGNMALRMSILQNLSALNKDMQKYHASINYARKALLLLQQTKQIQQLPSIYENIYTSWKQLGNTDSALYYHELFYKYHDSIYNEKRQKNFDELSIKYNTRNNENDLLVLKNKNLEKSIFLKEKQIVINTIIGSSFTIVIVIIMIWVLRRNKYKRDVIIRQKEIDQLKAEKEILAAQSLIEGEEKERKRIAQELHDGLGVLLSTASIHFSNVEEITADSEISEITEKASKLLKMAGSELRKVSHNMMPGVLTKFGLSDALEDLFDEIVDSGKLNIDYILPGEDIRLPENTEIMLYRATQEMLNNAIKYADASVINFNLSIMPESIQLTYKDDGVGFNLESKINERSIGLASIKSRIDFLHGTLDIKTEIGQGCEYSINIPV